MTKTWHFATSSLLILGTWYFSYRYWNVHIKDFWIFILTFYFILLPFILPFSILPDLDWNWTLSHVFWFNILSFLIKIFFKHRGFFHSVLFLVFFWIILFWISNISPNFIVLWLIYYFMYLINCSIFNNKLLNKLFLVGWAPFIYFFNGSELYWTFLLIIIFLSYLGHILGDLITNHWIYLINIWSISIKLKLPSILAFSTWWLFERFVIIPVSVISIFILIWSNNVMYTNWTKIIKAQYNLILDKIL